LNPSDRAGDNRSPALTSIVDVISRHVTDLALIGPEESPAWLAMLPVPAGWQFGRAENSPVQPTRTAVHRHDPLAGWDACETTTVFRFKGIPPQDIIRFNADCTLRAAGAHHIKIHPLQTLAGAMITAVRSSGYLTLTNQQNVWAQYSTYCTGEDTRGLLVEHGIFAMPDRLAGLRNDLTELSNSIHNAFVNTIEVMPKQGAHRSNSPGTGDLSPQE
jgi:hypothetical protein